MTGISSVNNSYSQVITNNFDDTAVTTGAAPQETAAAKTSSAVTVTDGMEKPAAKAEKPAVTMTTLQGLADPNYYKNSGIISHGGQFDKNGVGSEFQSEIIWQATPDMPSNFKSPADFDKWVRDNLSSPEDVTNVWHSFHYDYAHCLDVFAYSVLETFARKGGVCREDGITKTYMLNELGYEAKAVAYAEPDCFHVVSFFKNDEGTWDIAEYGRIHHVGAASFEEAIVQALPSGNNFWIWSDAEADKSAYVAKRVRTHHGLELTNFITGVDKQNGTVQITKGLTAGFDNEKATLHGELGKGWSIDARYNFNGDENSVLGGNMGGQNGSVWAAARKEFSNNIQLSLAYGYMPNMGVRDAGSSASKQTPMQMLALGANWSGDVYSNSWQDGRLRFASTADAQLSLPFYFHDNFIPEYMGMLLMDTEIDATSHNRLEWDATKDLTLYGGYTAALDLVHSAANLLMSRFKNWAPPALNQFAEIGAHYEHKLGSVSANLYAPITIFDSKYSDQFTWNVQGQLNATKDLKLSASVSGGFTEGNGISKVSAGITYKDNYSLKFSADGLNTQFKSMNFGVSLGINF